jgi:hypothetical protein
MRLENLKAKQKQKVEELKNKTAYYTTKTLLDRYDSPVASILELDHMTVSDKNII